MPGEEQIRLGLGQTASQRQSSPRAADRFGMPVRNTRWEAVVGAHLRSAPEPSYTSARMTRPLDGNDTVQEQRRRLGRRLRTLRVDSNMTQEALADRIGSAPQTLSDLENGRGRRAPARPLFDAYTKACLNALQVSQKAKQERWESLFGDYLLLRNLLARSPGGPDPELRPADSASCPGQPPVCPYPGLRAFTEETTAWFFGRDAQIEELFGLLKTRLHGGPPLFLTGASGAGKSSLLSAGLVPALRQERSTQRGESASAVLRITPGPHPLEALAQLHPETPYEDGVGQTVLIVDQFEEIFTQCTGQEERHAFVARLLELALGTGEAARPIPVVLAVRADFFHRCIAVPGMAEVMSRKSAVLGPMTEPDLREAIVGPARTAGLELEPGLVERLLRDLGVQGGGHDAGALPLLAHALQATWAQGDGRRMTLAGYQASGGIRDAVATTAQGVYDALEPEQQQAARRLLLRLVTVDEGGGAVRRRVGADELAHEGAAAQVALQRLVEKRLVTADDGVVQITHEALVRAWDLLRGWLAEDHDWLRVHRDLTAAAESWQSLGRDPGSLYRGHRLVRASDMAQGRSADLNPLECEFLEESETTVAAEIDAAVAEAEATRRSNRRLRRLTAALALLVLASLTATLVAGWQWRTAERERRTADDKSRAALASGLAAHSRALQGTRPGLAGLLALAGLRYKANDATNAAVLGALAVPTHPVRPLIGHSGKVTAVAVSPDGGTVATGGTDADLRLWRADQHWRPVVLPEHTGAVTAVAFSPGGDVLAATTAEGTVGIWDVRTAAPALRLRISVTGVDALAFGPDGRTLATGSTDGTAQLWERRTGRSLAKFTGHTGRVSAVAFGPDGRTLLTGSWDDTARLWDLRGKRKPTVLRGHRGEVYAVAYSPDGKTLATGSADGTARLWDTRTLRNSVTLRGHTRVVSAVAFGPDSRTLLTGSWDDTARLWDPRTHQEVGVLDGHTGGINAVAYARDGKTVVSASSDGTARVWATTVRRAGTALTGHSGYLDTVAFASDGRTLATGSRDGTTRLWDVNTRRTTAVLAVGTTPVLTVAFQPHAPHLVTGDQQGNTRLWDTRTRRVFVTLHGHTGAVDAVAFSPDGRTLATASTDGTARLWDTRTHRCLGVLRGHGGWVDAVAFSPDGRTLATASTDGTARLWDTRTHQTTARFDHDGRVLNALTFSPDGRTLAVAPSDGTAVLWDVTTHSVVRTITGHTDEVTAVAFSPDGMTLATGSRDRTARLHSLKDPEDQGSHPLATLGDATGWVTAVAFSPDGGTLATASWDRTARLTPVPQQWAHELCRRAGRNLTRQEWTLYVDDTPYERLCPNYPPARTNSP
ncbi:helix-turn-helix domain-containing protein [Streptomyces scabiei]|uniref:nSTAND1 domain-containing NTPase n=1 Tax=Streptomyces scabiei TaxID=1930 RepID=UPI0036E491E3